MVEQRPFKPLVGGSSPPAPTTFPRLTRLHEGHEQAQGDAAADPILQADFHEHPNHASIWTASWMVASVLG